MNIRQIAIGFGATLLLWNAPSNAAVQCTCPTVTADGEGNTSCSASESGERCTIDFNLFGPVREERAAQILAEVTHEEIFRPDPAASTVEGLTLAEQQGRLVDAVLVYLVVAAADQAARRPDTINTGNFSYVANEIREQPRRIEAAFSKSAADSWLNVDDESLRRAPRENPERYGGIILVPGCVEVQVNELWVMFKTYWSPARLLPRCAE